jgi:anti-sigma factor RsiW
MTHPTEAISAYLDGELSAAERAELTTHLSSCGRCTADLEGIQRVRAAVRALPVVEVPDGLFGDLDRGADVIPLHRNKGVWMGAAAALIAVVIAVAALLTPQPTSVSVDELSSRFGARVSLDPAFGPAKVVVPPFAQVSE